MARLSRHTWEAVGLAGAGVLCIASTLLHPPFIGLSRTRAGKPAPVAQGEAEQRLKDATRHLESFPEDFGAWVQAAIAHYSLGSSHYPAGLNALDRARRLGATGSDLFYYAGVMYEGLGLADYAINELEKFNRHRPGDDEILARLGNLYGRQGNWEGAARFYEQALSRRPRDATLWFNLGVAKKGLKDYDGALEAFSKAAKIAHGLPEGGEFEVGEVWRLKGDLPRAIEAYGREVQAFPEFLPALQALESIARQMKDWSAAKGWRQRISDVKAKTPPA